MPRSCGCAKPPVNPPPLFYRACRSGSCATKILCWKFASLGGCLLWRQQRGRMQAVDNSCAQRADAKGCVPRCGAVFGGFCLVPCFYGGRNPLKCRYRCGSFPIRLLPRPASTSSTCNSSLAHNQPSTTTSSIRAQSRGPHCLEQGRRRATNTCSGAEPQLPCAGPAKAQPPDGLPNSFWSSILILERSGGCSDSCSHSFKHHVAVLRLVWGRGGTVPEQNTTWTCSPGGFPG